MTDASYTKSESDSKYATKGSSSGGGLSSSGFTMTGDIDMGDNKILRLADPIAPKSATNKEYVDNNFLSKHGGLIFGDIAMSGQSITNLNPTPQNNNDAVTKGYLDNAIKLSGGLSISGITMQGDINMNGNEISGLADPINNDMAASKGFIERNFLDLAGGTMVGKIDMGGFEITNMLRTPTSDLSAVTKKWVTDEFPTKQEVLGGFTLTGSLDMNKNEIYGLPDTPTTQNSALSKEYVDSKVSVAAGYLYGLYVRKKDQILGSWTDVYDDVDKASYCWSHNVRGDVLTNDSNIKINTISFITNTSATALQTLMVDFCLGHFRTSMQYEQLKSLVLSTCSKATTHVGKLDQW